MGLIMSAMSTIMYLSEKLVLWMTCVGLISCVVLMFVVTLGMGIGLGYNYCFVDLRTRYKHVRGHYVGNYRSGENMGPDDARIDPTEHPLDADLRQAVEYSPEPGEISVTLKDNEEVPERSNFYRNTIVTNKTEIQDLVKKLGFNDTTEREGQEYTDEDEEVAQNNNVTNVYGSTNTSAEITTKIYSYSYPNFDDVDKRDKIDDTVTESTTAADPYSDDVTEAPVVDVDVDSQDQSGGKRVKKLVIPISGLDLISLLSKLKTENRNYSLQIVTT